MFWIIVLAVIAIVVAGLMWLERRRGGAGGRNRDDERDGVEYSRTQTKIRNTGGSQGPPFPGP